MTISNQLLFSVNLQPVPSALAFWTTFSLRPKIKEPTATIPQNRARTVLPKVLKKLYAAEPSTVSSLPIEPIAIMMAGSSNGAKAAAALGVLSSLMSSASTLFVSSTGSMPSVYWGSGATYSLFA